MDIPKFYDDPDMVYQEIHKQLTAAYTDRHHLFHTAQFSYINGTRPLCKTIVVRHCSDDLRSIRFHTDIRSDKIKSLSVNPNAVLHFYDKGLKIQIILGGTTEIHHKNNLTQTTWEETSLMSRRCYLVTDAPGAIQDQAISGIPDLYISSEPQKDMSETGYENFSIISLNVSEIEWLYLHHSGNRRARIKLTDTAYDFTWLIP